MPQLLPENVHAVDVPLLLALVPVVQRDQVPALCCTAHPGDPGQTWTSGWEAAECST